MIVDSYVFEKYTEAIEKEDIELAKKILLANIPDGTIIYRYCRGLNRDLNSLSEKKIWLSSVFNFNDPYDSAIMVDCGFKLQYPQEEREKAFEDYTRQQKANLDAEKIRSSIFVSCFSETHSSFPMWGYYAAEHKGLCLGYDLKELISKYNCFPVIYTDSLVVYTENDEKNMLKLSLTKSSEWEHEREWRIVKIDNSNKGEKGVVIEGFPNPLEIFVGCRQQDTDFANIDMIKNKIEVEKWYARLGDIMYYAEQEYIKLYLPMISRVEYKLIDRALILNK